jgi:hypothetical protein
MDVEDRDILKYSDDHILVIERSGKNAKKDLLYLTEIKMGFNEHSRDFLHKEP